MNATTLLLGNGFFLSFVLLILLIALAFSGDKKKPQKKRVKSDLKKIKEQIEEE